MIGHIGRKRTPKDEGDRGYYVQIDILAHFCDKRHLLQ